MRGQAWCGVRGSPKGENLTEPIGVLINMFWIYIWLHEPLIPPLRTWEGGVPSSLTLVPGSEKRLSCPAGARYMYVHSAIASRNASAIFSLQQNGTILAAPSRYVDWDDASRHVLLAAFPL